MEKFFNQGRWAVWTIWGIFALLAFCIWFSFYFDFVDLCDLSGGENVAVCARQWIGASSGYIAALFAGITIFFLYRQNAEQKKQTDFLLGDADPTLDAYIEHWPYIYLRVVNWNRRTLLIESIECHEIKDLRVDEVKLEHKGYNEGLSSYSPVFKSPVRVAAFDDRSRAPAICRIQVFSFGEPIDRPEQLIFHIHGRLLGNEHIGVKLTATVI